MIALLLLQLLMLVASEQALTSARNYFYLHRPLGCNLCEVSKRFYSVSHTVASSCSAICSKSMMYLMHLSASCKYGTACILT
jgi:hypothetical protein